MPLTTAQNDEVRDKVISQFGEEFVRRIDTLYVEFHSIRQGCRDSYEFLDRVIAKFPSENHALLLAAILYGMKAGEEGYAYYLMNRTQSERPLPRYGSAS